MTLIDDEKIVLESDSKEVILSTHRVRFETKRAGEASFISIMLDQISSCSIRFTSYPILIVFSVLSVLAGAYYYYSQRQPNGIILGVVIAALLLFIYWNTRKQVISIASPGATINFRMNKLGLEKGKQFIDEVEQAKDTRYLKHNKC